MPYFDVYQCIFIAKMLCPFPFSFYLDFLPYNYSTFLCFLIYFSSRNTIPKMEFLPFFIRGIPFPIFLCPLKLLEYCSHIENMQLIKASYSYMGIIFPILGIVFPTKWKKLAKKISAFIIFLAKKINYFYVTL